MSEHTWHAFDSWHALFDALCSRRGWFGNDVPASELCVLLGKNKVQDFDAAKKKLRGWRSGQRLPRRRNFVALAQLLEIELDPELEKRWTTLYRAQNASDASPGAVTAATQDATTPHAPQAQHSLRWVMAGVAALSVSVMVFAGVFIDRATAFRDLPLISFEGRVHAPVGAQVLVHGDLDGCGSQPPSWAEITAKLPATSLGVLEDGGLARKVMRRCGMEKVVRAVRYTGRTPGTEELVLFGDYVKIVVAAAR